MFEKTQIAASKVGYHRIAFQPGAATENCVVLRVRGDFVWVCLMNDSVVRLNRTASAKLIAGQYR